METRVQRKLEFHVKKSTRSTRSARKSIQNDLNPKENVLSPRKRNSDDENVDQTSFTCSPTKNRRQDRRRRSCRNETPVRDSLRTKLYPDESSTLKQTDCNNLMQSKKSTSAEFETNVKVTAKTKVKLEDKENTPVKQTLKKTLGSEQNCANSPVIRSPLGSPVRINAGLSTARSPIRSPVRVKPLMFDEPRKLSALKLQKQDGEVYHKAKQSFHTAKPERLVGRQSEMSEINKFVSSHISKKTAGSLYISGAPGTGKTATLSHILDDVKSSHSCKSLYLNCMALKDSVTVYGKLYTDLTGKSPPSAKDRLRAVEKVLTANGPSIIMVLDEIDQLDSKNQEILYTIFEWPSLQKSRLILIGIANALDLTDRILPRLQARPNCKPILLNFAPYNKDQIAAILQDRLHQLESDGICIVEPSAVQFCARKISAVAGDMRKALDVCRRAVEMVEHEVKSQRILVSKDCNSPSKSQGMMKKIGVMQISRVLSAVYGSSSSTQNQESIPLQQKLVVCALLLMVKLGKLKEVTMGKLHDTYTKICRRRQIAFMDYSEYQGVCTLLETRGIMCIKKVKEGRMAKVSLKLNETELEQTLQDKVLISSLIQEGLPK